MVIGKSKQCVRTRSTSFNRADQVDVNEDTCSPLWAHTSNANETTVLDSFISFEATEVALGVALGVAPGVAPGVALGVAPGVAPGVVLGVALGGSGGVGWSSIMVLSFVVFSFPRTAPPPSTFVATTAVSTFPTTSSSMKLQRFKTHIHSIPADCLH